MTGIDISEGAGYRIEDAVKESRKAIHWRGFVDDPVEVRHHLGDGARMRGGQAPQGSPQAGHQNGSRDSLARHVPDGESEAAAGQRKEIIIVAADGGGGAALAGIVQAGDRGSFLRKQSLLD